MLLKVKFVKTEIMDLEMNVNLGDTLEMIESRIKTDEREEYFGNNLNEEMKFIFRSRIWNDKSVNLEEMGIQDGMSVIVYTVIINQNNNNNSNNNNNNINNNLMNVVSSLLINNTNVNNGLNQNIPLNENMNNDNENPNMGMNINNNNDFPPLNSLPSLNNLNNLPPIASTINNMEMNNNFYESRIMEIQNMGFSNSRGEILDALREAGGSVNGAIDILLSN